jgi:pimeloyl-ACP methyl ester carboxylesterase
MPPPVQYARNGDVHIAFQIYGSGPHDILLIPGWTSHLLLEWEEPTYVRFLDRLASFARVVRFDKRGTGLSDRMFGLPTQEERMEDAHAVMDAAGLQRAVVFGWSEGGPMAMLFAATYPERVVALVLYGTQARFRRAPDYPYGASADQAETWFVALEANWGRTVDLHLSDETDARYQAWLLRYQQAAASPAAVVALGRANGQIDVRGILSSIHVPTLVVCRRDDPVGPEPVARYLAERIPGAKLVVLDGRQHQMWIGDSDALVDQVGQFVTGQRAPIESDRVLATILIADIKGSTERVVRDGDARWRDALAQFQVISRREIARHGGREIDMIGDQFMAAFEGPVRAIRCAQATQRDAASIGVHLRAGIHTGEVERAGEALRGIAVVVAARISAKADGDEILVSDTVRDIVAGAQLQFTDRGIHQLKGLPDARRLYAVS